MARGRPKKQCRNITSLKNQHHTPTGTTPNACQPGNINPDISFEEEMQRSTDLAAVTNQTTSDEVLDDGWHPETAFDSVRIMLNVNKNGGAVDSESEVEELAEWDDLDDEEFCRELYISALRFVLGRTLPVAWHDFSVTSLTLRISHQCSKPSLNNPDMNVSSYRSFIVN